MGCIQQRKESARTTHGKSNFRKRKIMNNYSSEVFVISRIIKVEIRVISRGGRLKLITLTETFVILDITKTESNNCFIIR